MKGGRKKRIWLWLLLGLLLLTLGVVWLLGSGGASARYDDPASIAAEAEESGFQAALEEDGTLTLTLDKQAIYEFAARYGLTASLRDRFDERPMGFRLRDGKLTVYRRVQALGLIPVSVRAEMSVSFDRSAMELCLNASRVYLGSAVPLPRRFWPRFFSVELRLPLGSVTDTIRDVRLEGETLVLTLEGIQSLPAGELEIETELFSAMELLLPEERYQSEAAEFICSRDAQIFPAKEAWRAALTGGDVPARLAEILALCTEDSVREVWAGADDLVRESLAEPIRERASALRLGWTGLLSEEQGHYERLLSAFREMAKSGGLLLSETGFLNASTGETVDPGALTHLSASATDSRFVFLCSGEGRETLSGGELSPISEMSGASARPEEAEYDLGAVLTTESGTPVLLYRRGDGALVLRQIDEALFVAVLVAREIPVLDVDALPPPARELRRDAGEGWNGAVLLLLEPTAEGS